MHLEGADGEFGDVRTIDIRGKELELLPPLLLDVKLVGCATFVVKDLEADTTSAIFEAGHDPICGGKEVVVLAGFEWTHQDEIGFHMVGEHEEVVAASVANQEPAHVISVNVSDGFNCNVDLL